MNLDKYIKAAKLVTTGVAAIAAIAGGVFILATKDFVKEEDKEIKQQLQEKISAQEEKTDEGLAILLGGEIDILYKADCRNNPKKYETLVNTKLERYEKLRGRPRILPNCEEN